MKEQLGHKLIFTFSKLNPKYSYNDLIEFFLKESSLEKINYKFKDKNLLLKAFIHKSFSHEAKIDLENNERLEFLGDSVLSLIVTDKIFKDYTNSQEGGLSKLRSTIVNEDRLNDFALFLNLDANILMGKGEFLNKGYKKKSLLSDTFESLLGAIYLDSNFETVKDFLLQTIDKFEQKKEKVFIANTKDAIDDKTKLQEMVYQKFQKYPEYETKKLEEGFLVDLIINDKKVLSIKDQSKKRAMQLLAKKALEKFKEISCY